MAVTFNINDFKSKLSDGGARSNQFSVQLNFPTWVGAGNLAGQSSQFLVDAAELPGQTLGVTPVYYRGREVKLSGERQFQPFTFTVLNDSGFTIRSAMEQWMDGINNRADNTGIYSAVGGFASYSQDIIIRQLNRNGVVLRSYTLTGAWPSDVGAVALGFDQNDRISTFQVALQYQTFSINTDLN
jgi:hypothetical protein